MRKYFSYRHLRIPTLTENPKFPIPESLYFKDYNDVDTASHIPTQLIVNGANWGGIERLMVAMLEIARKDLRRKSELLRTASIRWIISNDTTYQFSFRSICDHLGLSVSAVREQLLFKEELHGRGRMSCNTMVN